MKRAIPLKREFTEKPSKSIPKTVIKLAVALEPREESYANIQFDKSAESEYKMDCPIARGYTVYNTLCEKRPRVVALGETTTATVFGLTINEPNSSPSYSLLMSRLMNSDWNVACYTKGVVEGLRTHLRNRILRRMQKTENAKRRGDGRMRR